MARIERTPVRRLILVSLIAASGHAFAQLAPGGKPPIGLNIEINEQSLVNLAAMSVIFENDGQDAKGWPTSDFTLLFDNRYIFAWQPDNPNIDPLHFANDLTGQYKITFTGQAIAFTTQNGAVVAKAPVYDSATNRSTVEFDVAEPMMSVRFIKTRRTPDSPEGSGLTDISMVRESTEPAAKQMFNGVWLDSILHYPWAVLRTMDATKTNDYAAPASNEAYPYRLKWADRRLPGTGPLLGSDRPGVHGFVSWEDVVVLAQLSKKDLWINIPVNASDDYVDQLANLFKNGSPDTHNAGIPDSINLYVEYTNEPWHFDFPQGKWNLQAAQDEVAAGGSNLNYDGERNPERWRFRRLAKRTVEIGRQFRKVFSDRPERIRPVINNHKTEFDFDMLRYVAANYGEPANVLYAIAQEGYYTSADSSSPQKILAGEMAASDNNRTAYVFSRTLATYFGLHSVAYEGGADEIGGHNPNIADPGLNNKLAAARDPGMKDVVLHDLLGNWFPSGGELYVAYSQVGRYTYYGTYGLTEDIANLQTGKWLGHVAAMNAEMPPLNAGTLLPNVAGESAAIPVTPRTGQTVAPGPDPCATLLLRVQTAGTYSFALQGSRIRLMIDDSPAGTTMHLKPGLHALFAFLDAGRPMTLSPETKLIVTAVKINQP